MSSVSSPVHHEGLERLRRPWDWRDVQSEPTEITSQKIRRARELGVVAVLFTADQVAERTRELALLEHARRKNTSNNTVYAPVMQGGWPFAGAFFEGLATLSPSMDPIVDGIQATRYGDSQSGGAVLQVLRGFDPGTSERHGTDINGKLLVIVDDTIDEGVTVSLLGAAALDPMKCHQLGTGVTGPAADVEIVALTNKGIASLDSYSPEAITTGLWIPNVWAGGRGLNGPNEAMRWIPEVVITMDQHIKYRDTMPEVLEVLGARAIRDMDHINWIEPEVKE